MDPIVIGWVFQKLKIKWKTDFKTQLYVDIKAF